MTFIDSNIPMYLIGASHPHKTDAQILLERLALSGEKLVTDAEALQEILHRYAAIGRREAISPAFSIVLALADEVFPVEKIDVLRAGEIAESRSWVSARDALHIAVMERRDISSILSFDSDFDRWPGIHRIHAI